jgi:hypothetical protein
MMAYGPESIESDADGPIMRRQKRHTTRGNCSPIEVHFPEADPALRQLVDRIYNMDASFAKRYRETAEAVLGKFIGETTHSLVSEHCRHGPDYRDCTWNGVRYTFSATQAACIKVLWEASDNGTPEVGESTVLEMAGSTASKLRDVFKSGKTLHLAWGNMVLPGEASVDLEKSGHANHS